MSVIARTVAELNGLAATQHSNSKHATQLLVGEVGAADVVDEARTALVALAGRIQPARRGYSLTRDATMLPAVEQARDAVRALNVLHERLTTISTSLGDRGVALDLGNVGAAQTKLHNFVAQVAADVNTLTPGSTGTFHLFNKDTHPTRSKAWGEGFSFLGHQGIDAGRSRSNVPARVVTEVGSALDGIKTSMASAEHKARERANLEPPTVLSARAIAVAENIEGSAAVIDGDTALLTSELHAVAELAPPQAPIPPDLPFPIAHAPYVAALTTRVERIASATTSEFNPGHFLG